MDELISDQHRKYFYTIIFLFLAVIFFTRYFLIPYSIAGKTNIDHTIIYKALDDIFTSTIVTITIGSFIFWLKPRNKLNAQIKILQPVEIGEELGAARIQTEKWWFNGGSGSFTRAVTLPELSSLARKNNQSIEIVIQIIDPTNPDVCNNYVNYRNSLKSGDGKNKRTLKGLQLDLLSTIVSSYMWKNEQNSLNIQFALKDSFSLFRIDLSSSKAIITKEDPTEPAILYDAGTFFYKAQHDDLRQSFLQSKKLDMSIPFHGLNEINTSNTKILLERLELVDLISDEKDLIAIVKNAKSTKNPYA